MLILAYARLAGITTDGQIDDKVNARLELPTEQVGSHMNDYCKVVSFSPSGLTPITREL